MSADPIRDWRFGHLRWALALASTCATVALLLELFSTTRIVPLTRLLIAAFVPSLIAWGAFRWLRDRFVPSRHEQAERREDQRAVVRWLRWYAALLENHEGSREHIRGALISVHALREAWSDAVLLASHARPELLIRPWSTYVRNNAAWCLAMAGHPERALALAIEAARDSQDDPPLHAATNGTLGATLHLLGRHAEAIARLDEAYAVGGDPTMQAIRAYYLGLAHHALGHIPEACKWLEEVASHAPGSGWSERAAKKVAEIRPYR